MIIITGVAGAGKTTQCQKLEATGLYQWLSVGELLRTTDSKKIHDTVAQGVIIDDDITIPIVEAEIIRRDDQPELLLDGFPRSAVQASWLLNKHLDGAPFQIRHIVHITLSEGEVMRRLHERQRQDDYDKAIARRLATYEDVVLPIISQFTSIGIPTHEIDGGHSIEEVFTSIREAIA